MSVEYLVVLPVEEMPPGAAYPKGKSLPLHCTLMYWFGLSPHIALVDLAGALERLGGGARRGIELISAAPDRFGPGNDVPVHVLQHSDTLHSLHGQLLEFLTDAGSVPKNARWIGTRYRPHVTTVEGKEFAPGSRHRAKSLVLVKRSSDGDKTVEHVFQL